MIRVRGVYVFEVCQTFGLETGTAANDYIQLYDGGPEPLFVSLDRIQNLPR